MKKNSFGMLEGVFIPCLLSILGVIMFLRLGWVVGTVGFAGTVVIIVIANIITLSTALSMSSVVTNIRIGAGGAYSIISKSLGIEAGGAIGIPLYISQAISVAFYITGFSESWQFVFPAHNPLAVSLIAWFILLVVAYISAKLAFQLQYVVLIFISLSLISIFAGQGSLEGHGELVHSFAIDDFWKAFAIFFPAVTGILAGASMSGELEDPRDSIPKGTIGAIVISFVIYMVLALWLAIQVPVSDLLSNKLVAIDLGRWHWFVFLGIMGATLSSAIAMFVSSPRILLALSKHSLVPMSESFSRVSAKGEPSTAILFTALIALITILFGSLDEIAGLLTMFFLITYGMINITVFIEQSIGIASFRPSFRVSRIIPFVGFAGCLGVMLLINVKFSIMAFVVIVLMYLILLKRGTQVYSPDIRSGMLVYLAEKFARAANKLPYYPKIWKPNLVVPVFEAARMEKVITLLKAIIFPAGRLTFFKVVSSGEAVKKEEVKEQIDRIVQSFKDDNIFVEGAVVDVENASSGVVTVMQTLKGMFFPPNTLFCCLSEDSDNDNVIDHVFEEASKEGLGIVLLKYDEAIGVSQEKVINLWIRKQSPNINLSILMALQLERNWQGEVRILQVVDHDYEVEEAEGYLGKLKELMRMPLNVEIQVLVGEFNQALKDAPIADINIFGMQNKPDFDFIRRVAGEIRTSVLFLRDSENESALA